MRLHGWSNRLPDAPGRPRSRRRTCMPGPRPSRRIPFATIEARRAGLLVALVAAGGVACGEKPDPAFLELARHSLRTAESLDAESWAPETLRHARAAVAEAEAEYARQDRKLRRSRERGVDLARQAGNLARQASDETVAARRTVAQEARQHLRELELSVGEAAAGLAVIARCRPETVGPELGDVADRFERVRDAARALQGRMEEEDYRAVVAQGPELVSRSGELGRDVARLERATGCLGR